MFLAVPCILRCQEFSIDYSTEMEWNFGSHARWANLLCLGADIPLWEGGSLQVGTIHIAHLGGTVIDDWQGFSNIDEDNNWAALAVLGYMHSWEKVNLFAGVRNLDEDFFTTDHTTFFTGSSPSIFPTLTAMYPAAYYPCTGLTLHFDVTLGEWTFKNNLYNGIGYNGWKHSDNPFIVRPDRDGVFDIAQIEWHHLSGHYYLGGAFNTRKFGVDEQGEYLPYDLSSRKFTLVWWAYCEQPLWSEADRNLYLLAQYSQSSSPSGGCHRYGELGGIYTAGTNRVGLSLQYAKFHQGAERSAELSWRKSICSFLSVQPSFQYIDNKLGDYTVLTLRFDFSF